MSTNDPIPFSVVDYLMFSGMLVISTITGIYHGFAKGGQHSTSRYLLADKSMHFLPVSMSILVSFMSPLSIIGTPAEIYTNGTGYASVTLAKLWCLPMVAYIFLPVFVDLQEVSSYKYMELRFNFALRILVALIFMLQSVFYMAAVLIGPALAIEAVQNFELWKTLLITGILCTLYTTLGGMKGVIWTDVFQFFVIIGTLLAVIIMGVAAAGGIEEVYRVNGENGRLNHFSFDLDPLTRTAFFSAFVGGGFNSSPIYLSQTAVQRYMTTKSLKHSQAAVLLNILFDFFTGPCLYLTGMVLFAFYSGDLTSLQPALNATLVTDPENMLPEAGHIGRYEPNYSSADQILVYFVSSQFGNIPGIQGLFVACLFAGTLSSVSSALNAMTAVTLEDFIKPFRSWRARRTGQSKYENDERDTFISKILTCVYGVASIGLAFLASTLGSLLVLGVTILGITGGPIMGTFGVGMMYKRANGIGMLCGTTLGFGFAAWITFGAYANQGNLEEALGVYRVSYLMYGCYGTVVTILIGIIGSEIVRILVPEERLKTVDPILLAKFLRPPGWKRSDTKLYNFQESEDDVKKQVCDDDKGTL